MGNNSDSVCLCLSRQSRAALTDYWYLGFKRNEKESRGGHHNPYGKVFYLSQTLVTSPGNFPIGFTENIKKGSCVISPHPRQRNRQVKEDMKIHPFHYTWKESPHTVCLCVCVCLCGQIYVTTNTNMFVTCRDLSHSFNHTEGISIGVFMDFVFECFFVCLSLVTVLYSLWVLKKTFYHYVIDNKVFEIEFILRPVLRVEWLIETLYQTL